MLRIIRTPFKESAAMLPEAGFVQCINSLLSGVFSILKLHVQLGEFAASKAERYFGKEISMETTCPNSMYDYCSAGRDNEIDKQFWQQVQAGLESGRKAIWDVSAACPCLPFMLNV